jgi:ABC-type phosphate transport system permease subunit
MEHLILILCLSFVFAIVAGLHLYTMKKISDVQKNLMMEGKDWRALEKASASSLYTMLMLFLFSVLLAIPITGMVKLYLLLDYVVGG